MLVHRNSAKAIIVREGRLLVTRNSDPEGDWYILPGGGQNHSEPLHATLRRECLEEIGVEVTIGPLRFVREYIGGNHEYASEDSYLHQVEFMFECTIDDQVAPAPGSTPDTRQIGVAWLPLDQLHQYRLYPSVLGTVLKAGIDRTAPVYLGDVN